MLLLLFYYTEPEGTSYDEKVPSWSLSYRSCIYSCLCIQCLSPLKLWVWSLLMVMCTQYNITW